MDLYCWTYERSTRVTIFFLRNKGRYWKSMCSLFAANWDDFERVRTAYLFPHLYSLFKIEGRLFLCTFLVQPRTAEGISKHAWMILYKGARIVHRYNAVCSLNECKNPPTHKENLKRLVRILWCVSLFRLLLGKGVSTNCFHGYNGPPAVRYLLNLSLRYVMSHKYHYSCFKMAKHFNL